MISVQGVAEAGAEKTELLASLRRRYAIGDVREPHRYLQGYRLEIGATVGRFSVVAKTVEPFEGIGYQLATRQRGPRTGVKNAHRVLVRVLSTAREAADELLLSHGVGFAEIPKRGTHEDGDDIGDISLVSTRTTALVRKNVLALVVSGGASGAEADVLARDIVAHIDRTASESGVHRVSVPRIEMRLVEEEAVGVVRKARVVFHGPQVEFEKGVVASAGKVTPQDDGATITWRSAEAPVRVSAYAISRDGFVHRKDWECGEPRPDGALLTEPPAAQLEADISPEPRVTRASARNATETAVVEPTPEDPPPQTPTAQPQPANSGAGWIHLVLGIVAVLGVSAAAAWFFLRRRSGG
jgi:hypothetical protein